LSVSDIGSYLDEVDSWVEAKPGEKMFYLNEGYYLLEELISKVTGRPYARYVTDEILRPLGMNRSYFSREQIERDKEAATPYVVRGEKITTSVYPYGGEAAGGLVTNVIDLANFVTMLSGRGEFAGKRLIGEDTLEKMETPYTSWPRATFPGQGYGYGLEIIPDFYGHKVAGHGGSVEVFTASFLYAPRRGYGVVVMANGTGYSMERIGLYGMALLTGKNPEDLPMIKLENALKRVEGKYAAYKNVVLAEAKRNGSFLTLSGDDIGENIVLVPDRVDNEVATFFTLAGTAKMAVEFRFSGDGVEMIYERYKYRKTGPPILEERRELR
jgi:CubicO group peptidase (beta-lactamase class C family)